MSTWSPVEQGHGGLLRGSSGAGQAGSQPWSLLDIVVDLFRASAYMPILKENRRLL